MLTLSQPNHQGREADKSGEVSGELVISCHKAAKLFRSRKQVFDQQILRRFL